MTNDMRAADVRRFGYEVVDWIVDYLESVGDLPVLPQVAPGELRDALPAHAPETGEPFERILEDFRNLIVPANTHWAHPRFLAYFSTSASAPGILAEALTAALNVNGMLWKSSPAATELEQVTTAWVREWLGLPESFFGEILDTASTSTFHALVAAREHADPDARIRGARGSLIVYTSEQAHSSVEKGAIAAGYGQQNVRKIGVDGEFRLQPSLLEAAMQADVEAGLRPCCVVPTVGTTSTTAIDPVRDAVAIAHRYGAWAHVDAAFGGSAAVLPEMRHILDGADQADSLVVNPHKWLFTPVDCSLLYTSRPGVLRRAFSLTAEYLKTAQDGEAVNYMNYGVPLGRRFRSLKLWFVMRSFGRERIAAVIRNHIAWARELAREIEAHPQFELCAPVPLSLVCFRYRGSDEENRRIMDQINASGFAFLSHTVLNGRFVIRMAIGNLRTSREDIMRVWQAILAIIR